MLLGGPDWVDGCPLPEVYKLTDGVGLVSRKRRQLIGFLPSPINIPPDTNYPHSPG
ncbi:hypothetical protein Hanom_Chr05g00445191 [Helianthus anomalus]